MSRPSPRTEPTRQGAPPAAPAPPPPQPPRRGPARSAGAPIRADTRGRHGGEVQWGAWGGRPSGGVPCKVARGALWQVHWERVVMHLLLADVLKQARPEAGLTCVLIEADTTLIGPAAPTRAPPRPGPDPEERWGAEVPPHALRHQRLRPARPQGARAPPLPIDPP